MMPGDACWEKADAPSAVRTTTALANVFQRFEGTGSIDNLSADHREQRLGVVDLADRHRQVILRQHRQIRELAGFERPALLLVERKPRAAERVETQGRRAIGR